MVLIYYISPWYNYSPSLMVIKSACMCIYTCKRMNTHNDNSATPITIRGIPTIPTNSYKVYTLGWYLPPHLMKREDSLRGDPSILMLFEEYVLSNTISVIISRLFIEATIAEPRGRVVSRAWALKYSCKLTRKENIYFIETSINKLRYHVMN